MSKRNQFILPSIIIVIALLFVGDFAVEKFKAMGSFVSQMFESDSEKIHRKIFLLSDGEIGKLISEGMDLNSESWRRVDSINELPLIQSAGKEEAPIVFLDTPRNEIPSRVYMNMGATGWPHALDSFGDRPFYEVYFPVLKGKNLIFSIGISLSEEEHPPDLTVSLKQSGRKVYTEKSSQPDQKKYMLYDEETKLFSDDRFVRFDADPKVLDYSKPAELYVSWDDTSDYAVYELDFQKFIK